jgi:hypothetical protein
VIVECLVRKGAFQNLVRDRLGVSAVSLALHSWCCGECPGWPASLAALTRNDAHAVREQRRHRPDS